MVKAKLSLEQQAELAVSLGFCLECGGKLCRTLEGENVCTRCGLVWGGENTAETIPFPQEEEQRDKGSYEGHWQPPNSLAFLKSLGDPALENSGKGLMRVLALSINGSEDLGIRARHIRVMIQAEDPPGLRRVLSRVSDLLKTLGYSQNWELANYAGNLSRAAVAFKLLAKIEVNTSLADAIVLYALKKFGLNNYPVEDFKPREEDLALLSFLDRFKVAKRRRNTKI